MQIPLLLLSILLVGFASPSEARSFKSFTKYRSHTIVYNDDENDGDEDDSNDEDSSRPERRAPRRDAGRDAGQDAPRERGGNRNAERRQARPNRVNQEPETGEVIVKEDSDDHAQEQTPAPEKPQIRQRQKPRTKTVAETPPPRPADPAVAETDNDDISLDYGDEKVEKTAAGAAGSTHEILLECDSPISHPPLQPLPVQPSKTEPAPPRREARTQPQAPQPKAPAPAPHPERQPAQSQGHKAYVQSLAGSSACGNYNWRSRGRAPKGYTKGVALSFARSLCRLKVPRSIASGSALAAGMAVPARLIGSPAGSRGSKDTLVHYGSTLASLGINPNSNPAEAVRASYVIGFGLGMRESSGKWCEGADASARGGRGGAAIEAGAFQTSFDSMTTTEQRKLFEEYKSASPERCQLNVWQEGVKCSVRNVGGGEALKFQQLSKTCPAFAAEYAAATMRVLRNHYGPLNRKEAEATPACNNLLKEVQGYIEADATRCEEFL